MISIWQGKHSLENLGCFECHRTEIVNLHLTFYRQTLERAVSQKIPMKKMRTLFKKYLEFEQQHGTEEHVTKVKVLAANYVENAVNS